MRLDSVQAGADWYSAAKKRAKLLLTPQLPADFLPLHLPRLPVFGWDVFRGGKDSALPCILDHSDVVYTGSGRAAIALALSTLRIGRGDAVLVPTFHCPTMVSPIVATGAEPLFFPIDGHGAPRLDIVSKLKLDNVRAMLVAHYFGLPQPMALIRQFCDRLGIVLIEDCAHAMFGEVEGRPVGAWGDSAIASLTKFFPVTDGGCLLINAATGMPLPPPRRSLRDEFRGVANAIDLGAQYGKLGLLNAPTTALFSVVNLLRPRARSGAVFSPADRLDQTSQGNSTKDPPPVAIDSSGASVWAKWIARTAHRERIVALRRRNYQHWAGEAATIEGARALMPELPDAAAPYVFPLWVERPEASYMAIRAAGVPIFRWDQIWPGTPSIEDDCGVDWATHVFQVGCHQDLSVDDLARMAHRVRQILSGSGSARRDCAATGTAAIT